jgi:hypothetical protein
MSLVLASDGELIGHAYAPLFLMYYQKYKDVPYNRESTDVVENNKDMFEYFKLNNILNYQTVLNSILNYGFDLPQFIRDSI